MKTLLVHFQNVLWVKQIEIRFKPFKTTKTKYGIGFIKKILELTASIHFYDC